MQEPIKESPPVAEARARLAAERGKLAARERASAGARAELERLQRERRKFLVLAAEGDGRAKQTAEQLRVEVFKATAAADDCAEIVAATREGLAKLEAALREAVRNDSWPWNVLRRQSA
jgi:hypothetical protein